MTGAAHLGAPLVERGRWAGNGRRNKGIGRLGGPAPAPPRDASCSFYSPPHLPRLREGSGVGGLGSPPVLGQRPSTWRGSKPHWTPTGFPPFLREAEKELLEHPSPP